MPEKLELSVSQRLKLWVRSKSPWLVAELCLEPGSVAKHELADLKRENAEIRTDYAIAAVRVRGGGRQDEYRAIDRLFTQRAWEILERHGVAEPKTTRPGMPQRWAVSPKFRLRVATMKAPRNMELAH